MARIRTHAEEGTHAVGLALAALLSPGDVLLLSGDLGAGKTALVKGIAEGLGVSGPVTSPTFNILLVHRGRVPLYHIDLYRLEHADQLEDIDYFGTIESDGVTAVEWGDRFPEAAPADHLDVRISIEGDADRMLEVRGTGERSASIEASLPAACRGIVGIEVLL